MKKLSYILTVAIIAITSCTNKTLDEKTAIELIKKNITIHGF